MKNLIKLAICSSLVSLSAFSFADTTLGNNSSCPEGFQHINYRDAVANSEALCETLGTWDIVHLANGASMSGSGYDCQVFEEDPRALGKSLCKALPKNVVMISGQSCPEGMTELSVLDASLFQAEVCEKMGAWDIVKLGNGGSISGSGYDCTIFAEDSRVLGATFCHD